MPAGSISHLAARLGTAATMRACEITGAVRPREQRAPFHDFRVGDANVGETAFNRRVRILPNSTI